MPASSGRPARRSSSAPPALSATSTTLLPAAIRARAAVSAPSDGARPARASAGAYAVNPARSAARAPNRAASRPPSGRPATAPASSASTATPSWLGTRPSCSWIAGIRAAQLADTRPVTRNASSMPVTCPPGARRALASRHDVQSCGLRKGARSYENRRLDARKLATLRAVVEHGSLSAAARACSLTQPAVSRQVALLEAQLGTPLVERTRRGVRPTPAGRLLAEHAAGIERRLERAEEEVGRLAGHRRARVRLGSFFTAFAQLTPELEAAAERRLPAVELVHELIDREGAYAALAAGRLDAAVVFEHGPAPPPAGIALEPLFSDPARVLLPAPHALARRR